MLKTKIKPKPLGGKRGVAAVELGEVFAFFALEEIEPQRVNLAQLHREQAEALNPVEVGQSAVASVDRVDQPAKLDPVHGRRRYTCVFLETNSTP